MSVLINTCFGFLGIFCQNPLRTAQALFSCKAIPNLNTLLLRQPLAYNQTGSQIANCRINYENQKQLIPGSLLLTLIG